MIVVTLVFEDDDEGMEFVEECREEDIPAFAVRVGKPEKTVQ